MGQVECLNCGKTRACAADACPRCGYVGWAASADLSETARRQLRDRPLSRRRLLTLA